MIPGETITVAGEIVLNAGAEALTLLVANTGDRPFRWVRTIISLKRTLRSISIAPRRAGCV